MHNTFLLADALRIAVEALEIVESKKASVKSAFYKASKEHNVSGIEALRMAYRIVYESIKSLNLVDAIAESIVGSGYYERLPSILKNILRVVVYEFRVEPSRSRYSVSDYISAFRSIYGWRILQPIEPYLGRIVYSSYDQTKLHELDRIALKYRQPRWLIEYLEKILGRGLALEVVEGFQAEPRIYVRINTFKIGVEDCLKILEDEGFKLRPIDGIPYVYALESYEKPIPSSRAYRDGLICIQDLSSCYSVALLDPKPGERILDLCAAPGVKTSYLLQMVGGKIDVLSVDVSVKRIHLMKSFTMKLSTVDTNMIVADGRYLPLADVKFDAILLDPPCSGTGILHRDPAFKWRLTYKRIARFAKLQYELLESAARYVRSGGRIVYSTCSLTLEENELVLERFLRLNPEFYLSKPKMILGSDGLRGLIHARRLYPHRDLCNGFFVAVIRRV
ncbi:MAG: RsmB/NOP family class I SAM-dependent RNA methyltransferase [Nitrososphaerota archaeon]|nr:methyltransferase domain-containing protein [Candidatus Bathyarchaeota archaeon]MCX8161880.1 methyltransferase domain-containing protein [Candidatus Bathyarchaeota archaeon]MDW8061449.1 RsmB/NOP family class I SAM-dependent RNA methyltransferase [Nitrososphaerota archaeon]